MEKTVEIAMNKEFGRHVLAKENIKASNIVLNEFPFVIGPKQNSLVVCLGCYTPVNITESGNSRCSKCGWPLCKDCYDSKDHQAECEVFSSGKVVFQWRQNISEYCPQLDCITPLRVLLKMEADPERWENEVAPMEYHDEPRRKCTDIWNADLINVAKYLRGPCNLKRFSEDLIMQVIGILEVNAFEARTSEGYPLRGLYPLTGILAHNCVPNTTRSIYPSEGFRIRLRAMVDIKNGEQLKHSYTYTLDGTTARQVHLLRGKYFTCRCERCSDPTELGTHFSSFKCSECNSGLLTSTDPLDISAEWKCSNCDFKKLGRDIQKAVGVMQTEVAQVSMEMFQRLERTEKLFKKFQNVLHSSHFIQTILRQNLIEMYGRVEGYELGKLPDELLDRKEELCRNVLEILNVFEPGLSRSRAMILYEMHIPIILKAKNAYQKGSLTGKAFKEKLTESLKILEECLNILQFEDPTSAEGNLATFIRQSMDHLEKNISEVV